MIASRAVVQCIQHQVESLVEANAVSGAKNTVMVSLNLHIRIKLESSFACNICLRLSDVLFVEQELAVQVAYIDGVEINLKQIKKSCLSLSEGYQSQNLQFRCL